MNTTLREFVHQLSVSELWAVHESYTEFEEKGAIGEAPCRAIAERFLKLQGIWFDNNHIAVWMDYLAHEVYRRLALTYGQKPLCTVDTK